MSRLTKRLVTHVTFVRFISRVSSAVSNKVTWCCESFATNSTFKWFLSWMTSPVYCKVINALKTLATFCALVFTCMNILMSTKGTRRWKTLLTVATRIQVFSSVSSAVINKVIWSRESFATNSTLKCFLSWMTSSVYWQLMVYSFAIFQTSFRVNIRPWLVIVFILSCITTISFKLYFKRVPCTSKNHRQTLTDDKTYETTFQYVINAINHSVFVCLFVWCLTTFQHIEGYR